MPDEEPKWRRRKDARPGEIVDAALEVFAEKGFAAAKLDDIARRAGISKATLYLYFETKEEIFRAVARAAVASLIEALESPAEGADAPFAEIAPRLLSRAAGMMSSGRVPSIARMVIGESRNFPDLARIWHDDVVTSVIGTVTGIIARAQARGEVATACRHPVSGTVSLPSSGCFSPFPHSTCALSVGKEYLGLEGGPPMFRQGFTCPALLKAIKKIYV